MKRTDFFQIMHKKNCTTEHENVLAVYFRVLRIQCPQSRDLQQQQMFPLHAKKNVKNGDEVKSVCVSIFFNTEL